MRMRKFRMSSRPPSTSIHLTPHSFKVGDSFVSLSQPQVLELLEASTTDIDSEVVLLREKLEGVQDEMAELKKALYGRFGRSINLET
jgi:chaperonin cofactor prefoldin